MIFTLLLSRSASEIQDLLSADLSLTLTALRQYPKVYWIWNHRRWCLEHVPDGPGEDRDGWRNANWAKELYFVEKMLDADARNCKSRTCYNHMSRLIDHSSRVELPALCASLATDSSLASSRACLHNGQNRIKLFQL